MQAFLGAALCLVASQAARGYVMPAEQILDFTAKNFSVFKTVVIDQTVRQEDMENEEGGVIYREKIWMQSPDGFRSERQDGLEVGGDAFGRQYRSLLMAGTPSRLMRLLAGMGINLQQVAFTRSDGIVAYRIGGETPEGPEVVIEKERFLPLLLIYKVPTEDGPALVKVTFRDYRKLEKTWYPFEISCSRGTVFHKTCMVLDLKVNVPVTKTLSSVPGAESSPPTQVPAARAPEENFDPPEKERLKNILKAFEEKYQ